MKEFRIIERCGLNVVQGQGDVNGWVDQMNGIFSCVEHARSFRKYLEARAVVNDYKIVG